MLANRCEGSVKTPLGMNGVNLLQNCTQLCCYLISRFVDILTYSQCLFISTSYFNNLIIY